MSTARSSDDVGEQLKPGVLAMQIVVGAMPVGVIAFAAFAVWRQITAAAGPADLTIKFLTLAAITLVILLLMVTQIGGQAFVRRARAKIVAGDFQMGRNAQDQSRWQWLTELGDAGKLFFVYQRRTVSIAVLLEAAALLNVSSYLLGGNPVALVVAGLLTLALLALIPTTGRVVDWIDRQSRLLTDARSFAR